MPRAHILPFVFSVVFSSARFCLWSFVPQVVDRIVIDSFSGMQAAHTLNVKQVKQAAVLKAKQQIAEHLRRKKNYPSFDH